MGSPVGVYDVSTFFGFSLVQKCDFEGAISAEYTLRLSDKTFFSPFIFHPRLYSRLQAKAHQGSAQPF